MTDQQRRFAERVGQPSHGRRCICRKCDPDGRRRMTEQRRAKYQAVAFLIAVSIFGVVMGQLTGSADAKTYWHGPERPHKVTLRDASSPPAVIVYVEPQQTRCVPLSVAFTMSDVQAYTWRGGALPVQSWSRDRLTTRWGRVSYNGICFTNDYTQPVLGAAWTD